MTMEHEQRLSGPATVLLPCSSHTCYHLPRKIPNQATSELSHDLPETSHRHMLQSSLYHVQVPTYLQLSPAVPSFDSTSTHLRNISTVTFSSTAPEALHTALTFAASVSQDPRARDCDVLSLSPLPNVTGQVPRVFEPTRWGQSRLAISFTTQPETRILFGLLLVFSSAVFLLPMRRATTSLLVSADR